MTEPRDQQSPGGVSPHLAAPADVGADAREIRIAGIAELVGMAVFFALGLWISVTALQMGVTNALGIGPGMFPLVSGLVLSALGATGLVTELLRRRRGAEPDTVERSAQPVLISDEPVPGGDEEKFTGVKWMRLGFTVVFVFVFIAVVPYLGFALSLTLLTFALLILVAQRTLVLALILSVVVALITQVGFGMLLDIRLPPATLPFLTWINL